MAVMAWYGFPAEGGPTISLLLKFEENVEIGIVRLKVFFESSFRSRRCFVMIDLQISKAEYLSIVFITFY